MDDDVEPGAMELWYPQTAQFVSAMTVQGRLGLAFCQPA
jgi:hypothetical protein